MEDALLGSASNQGAAGNPVTAPQLAGGDSWTDAYFTSGRLKGLDRLRSAGD